MLTILPLVTSLATAPAAPESNDWIDLPFEEWPRILLQHHADFGYAGLLSGGGAYLFEHEGELLVGTSKHVLGDEFLDEQLDAWDIPFRAESWSLRPAGSEADLLRIAGFWGSGSVSFDSSAIVLRPERAPEDHGIEVLELRIDDAVIGEDVYVVGPDPDAPNGQRVLVGQVIQIYPELEGVIDFMFEEPLDLDGWGGAVVLDEQGAVFGSLSLRWNDAWDDSAPSEYGDSYSVVPLLDYPPALEELARYEDELAVREVVFSPDGERVAIAPHDENVWIWDAHLRKYQSELITDGVANLHAIDWSPDGAHVLTGDVEGNVVAIDAESGEIAIEYGNIGGIVYHVGYSPDGRFVFAVDQDPAVTIWQFDAATGEEVHRFERAADAFRVSDDSAWLAGGHRQGRVYVWNLETRERAHILRGGHGELVSSLAFSPDGEYLASGSFDGTICLWDLESGELVRDFPQDDGGVHALEFVDGGRGLVAVNGSTEESEYDSGSVDIDCFVRVFRVEDGEEIARSHDHWGTVFDLSVHPDGARIVTCASDGFVRVWALPEIPEIER